MGKLGLVKFAFEQYARLPPVLQASPSLAGRTVMVTGATSGIGFETAKHFAEMHPERLILGCRNEEKGRKAIERIERETGCKTVELGILDMASFESVKAFAKQYENDSLDILVANAATADSKYATTKDGWEEMLQVNHLSTALLVLLLVPALVRTGKASSLYSRLVIVSCSTHHYGQINDALKSNNNALGMLEKMNDGVYCTQEIMRRRYFDTKLLNVFFTRALAHHLPSTLPLIPTIANPGLCYSNLRNYIGLPHIVIVKVVETLFARTAEKGARALVWAAIGPDGKDGEHVPGHLRGAYVSVGEVKEPSDSVLGKEGWEDQERIWSETLFILSKVAPEVQEVAKQYLVQ